VCLSKKASASSSQREIAAHVGPVATEPDEAGAIVAAEPRPKGDRDGACLITLADDEFQSLGCMLLHVDFLAGGIFGAIDGRITARGCYF
jgi:hypothetical protein